MSENGPGGHRNRSFVGGIVGRVAPAVMRQIDTQELVDSIDVDLIAQSIDLDVLLDRLDVNAIAERLDLDALVQRLDVNAIAGQLDLEALVQQLDVNAIATELDIDSLVQRLDVNAVATELDIDDLVGRVDVNAIATRLDMDLVVDRLDVNAIAAQLDLDALVQRVDINAIATQLDLDALVQRLDINAIAAQLDLDALIARLDLDALVEHLDLDAIAAGLDLDALVQRIDINAIAAQLDLDALVDRIDVNAVAERIDMAKLTAGATTDVAVSGLDLVRRQLIRVDATVEGVVDRVLRRGRRRPVEPRGLGPTFETELPVDEAPHELQRHDVSGHYTGPVTRGLAVAGDLAAVAAIQTVMAGVALVWIGVIFDFSTSGSAGRLLGLLVFGAVIVLYYWIPVALFGRTPAMAVVGIAVIGRNGAIVGWRRALGRSLVVPLSLAIIPIAYAGIVVGRERRALHDAVAGTVVVYDWGEREAERPATIRDQLSAGVRRRRNRSTAGATATDPE